MIGGANKLSATACAITGTRSSDQTLGYLVSDGISCAGVVKIGLILREQKRGLVEKAHLNPMMLLSTAHRAVQSPASAFGIDEPVGRAGAI